jgi:hypothetical protein
MYRLVDDNCDASNGESRARRPLFCKANTHTCEHDTVQSHLQFADTATADLDARQTPSSVRK